MSKKIEFSRITIDLPVDFHKKLKALAAMQGKSMRKIVVDLIDEQLSSKTVTKKRTQECPYSHIPNKVTAKAIKDAKEGKGLSKPQTVAAFLKKLGI